MDNKLLCTEGLLKVEYQQYDDGTHICIADKYGNWLADCGPQGDKESEANAKRIVTAWNCHDKLVKQLSLMTYLVRLKYGNLDKDVYAQIEESENLIDSLKHKP